ncbi:NHLP family bacteriocin export ABC transporter peptidase/permease/ATPase subunit [Rugosimonospora acidiphila]|uniref:NHLP family bacteriocin export ABC transporter peptidase/permease/ATPase subunit n=1 Tax=Rugosimonospora acidiphila TaxID=556531 RepID=UPI0031E6C4E5
MGEKAVSQAMYLLPETARRRHKSWKTPVRIQMESVECGAAALGILLAHYGRHVPLEQLRSQCRVSRNGSNAKDLLSAAREHGFEAVGYQMDLDELQRLRAPAIIFWAFQHFMVIEGFSRRWGKTVVRVNDPAAGRKKMTWDEFNDGFTGVVIMVRPGPDFRQGGAGPSTFAALRSRRVSAANAVVLMLLASLLLVVPGIIGPAFNRVFYDSVLSGSSPSYFWPLLSVMACTVASSVLISHVQYKALARTEAWMSVVSTAKFIRHLLRLPMGFFLQRKAAELEQRVGFNGRVAEVLARDLVVSVVNMFLIVFYAVFLLRYSLLLGAVGIGMAMLNVVLLQRVIAARRALNDTVNADMGGLVGTTYHTLRTMETVKATAGEDIAHMRWAGFYAKVLGAQQRIGVASALLAVVPPFLATINSAFILLLGGMGAVNGVITVGTLIAFQSLLAGLNRPISELTNLSSRIQTLGAEVVRLKDVEDYPADPSVVQENGDDAERPRLSGLLVVKDLSFGYSTGEPPVISDVTFTLAPGGRLALVGTSGSGKSTIGRVIAGLVEPTAGVIVMDGRPRQEHSRTVLAASVGYVDQDVTMYSGSVKDNLTLWDDSIPDELVLAALDDAEMLETVTSRPGGIHANLGEDGANLSGGQRQRLEIARALVAQPTMLVLDEATSALDPETERKVIDNLRRRGCSAVVIAHRLSTIRDADEIIVIDKGKVVERGTHDELMSRGQVYPGLVRSGISDQAEQETPFVNHKIRRRV